MLTLQELELISALLADYITRIPGDEVDKYKRANKAYEKICQAEAYEYRQMAKGRAMQQLGIIR